MTRTTANNEAAAQLLVLADELTRAIRKVHADGNGVCLPTAVDLMDPVDQSTEDRLRDYAREILDALRSQSDRVMDSALHKALKRARPWLKMIADEKGRPETSDIHAVLREVDSALAAQGADHDS